MNDKRPSTPAPETCASKILERSGAAFEPEIAAGLWSKILDQRRIILPLTEADLAKKHGVTSPKAILFFGPPKTGKTHFAKAIAGILAWWYIEIEPSMLMAEGVEKVGTVKIYWGGADTVMCAGTAVIDELAALCLTDSRPPL